MHRSDRNFRFLILVFCAVTLGGCGCGKSAPKTSDSLRVWHWMTDREEAFAELAAQYQHATGTPVRFELYAPSDLYVQKVRAAAQTDGLPDIFSVLGESRDLASFINAGYVLPLTEAMNTNGGAWRGRFFPIALAMNMFQEGNLYGAPAGTYGVPIDVMNLQVYYNKRLLSKLGLNPEQPPSTWDDWLAVGKLARAQHLVGLVSGWSELWLIDAFASSYAIHLMGREQVESTIRGDVAYSSPKWVEVFKVFEQLRDSGLLAEGIVTMGNKRAEQLFANEQAVFAFNGTWGVNVYQSMNPELDYGVMMLPRIKPNRPMVTWGGAGSSFMVNAHSPKREQAVAFLQWLTEEPQQRRLLETTHNIPSNREAAAALSGPLAAFADDMEAVVHPRLFAAQEHSSVIEAFDKGIQSILIGEQSPAQVAQAIAHVKQLENARHASREHSGSAPGSRLQAQDGLQPRASGLEPHDAIAN